MRRCLDREPDAVAVAHQAERAAAGGVRRDVQHDGAEGGAAHARVGHAHHVLDALGGELLRDRQIAGLRHGGRRMRAGVLQHQNVVGGDVELGIVDARGEVLQRGEHHRPALVLEQLGVGGRALEDGALRREVAEQRDQPALRLQRLVALGDDAAVDPGVAASSRAPAARPASRRSPSWRRDAAGPSIRASARPCRRRRRNPPCSRCRPASGSPAPAWCRTIR